jgi:hypothetical protein
LQCESCGGHGGWLSHQTYSFISEIITRFGPLTAPITIRRGERISNNSGCEPEYRPVESGTITEDAMRKHEFFPSTYYNAKDVSTGPIMLTIDHVAREPVGDGTNKQDKPVAHFKEPNAKLLVLTPTKYDAISLIAQSDETEDWPGLKIVLEAGKASFQGKTVDSVTVRAPRKAAPRKPLPPEDEFYDEV